MSKVSHSSPSHSLPILTASLQTLFGTASHPWPSFRPVNDTLRGGSSTSFFLPSPSSSTHSTRFSGHLDTKTLGGAGFASQATTFSPSLSFSNKDYSGLTLTLVRPIKEPRVDQPTQFVLVIKNEIPEDREGGGGRRESNLSYEFSFDTRELGMEGTSKVVLLAEWGSFVPTFRGREQKEAPPLDPTAIHEIVSSIIRRVGSSLMTGTVFHVSFRIREAGGEFLAGRVRAGTTRGRREGRYELVGVVSRDCKTVAG